MLGKRLGLPAAERLACLLRACVPRLLPCRKLPAGLHLCEVKNSIFVPVLLLSVGRHVSPQILKSRKTELAKLE